MNSAEQKLARLALNLTAWAEQLRWDKENDPVVADMRNEVAEIKTMLGGDKPGSDWRRFIMEGFC